jgi:hypothetical protein
MNNFISINGKQIELTEEQVKKIIEAYGTQTAKPLAEYVAGDTVKIGNFEMVVLEQLDGQTALILKGMYGEETEFGEKNNAYDGSYVDQKCEAFAKGLEEIVGLDNIVQHKVDLTSDDGLKDYGVIERRASLITTDMYRKFVEILDTVNPKCWWWLATPHSTKRHGNDTWAKCVSPSGSIYRGSYFNGRGVRPFCILKSSIFDSFED